MHNRIKELRELRGLTQADLAKRLGTTKVSVGRYEREPSRVTLPLLEKIATALRVSPVEIITAGTSAPAREGAVYLSVRGAEGTKRMALDADLAETLGKTEHLEVIHIEDDSMEPTLRVGDICVVDVSATKVSRDGIYVIEANGRLVIRRVAYNPVKDAYVASADNKLYADVWDIHDDDLTFVGRVAYAGRRM